MNGIFAGEKAAVLTLPRECSGWDLFQTVSQATLPALLESSRSDPVLGRSSIVAANPFLVVRSRAGRGTVKSQHREYGFQGDPFPVLRAELDRCRVAPAGSIPFLGGAIGYLGYPLRQWTGAVAASSLPACDWPDLHLAFYDHGFVVDHAEGVTHLVSTGWGAPGAARRAEKRRTDLEALRALAERAEVGGPSRGIARPAAVRFETSREEYLGKIRRARAYLAAGEIYQVNLSHRIALEGEWDSASLYRLLRQAHPASFSAYLPLPGCAILCASPERFVKLAGRRAETRPIKGTRARPASPEMDGLVKSALAASPKERAENVMIVDLARNDLGRVCIPGSVVTEDLCAVETLPSVHHLVSTVHGTLRESADRIDLVQALFPGGSMTGAPKIRAMQIIDELEGRERGIYSGSLGYFSFHGDLDLNIVIRTLIVSGRSALLQVGGAVLAESDPEAEYQETLDKARPLLDLLAGPGKLG
jgi:para-aminobenzoate synthetase component 1